MVGRAHGQCAGGYNGLDVRVVYYECDARGASIALVWVRSRPRITGW